MICRRTKSANGSLMSNTYGCRGRYGCLLQDEAFVDNDRLQPPNFTSTSRQGLRCTGDAAEALQEYRQLLKKLRSEGVHLPYAPAYTALRDVVGTPSGDRRVHGDIDGVPIGLIVESKGEAAILGLHCVLSNGIDSKNGQPCYAVCMSGNYPDDNYDPINGNIIYTGSGGHTRDGRIPNQTENQGNKSLKLSKTTRKPIRALRKMESGCFRYEGLYLCTGWKYETGSERNMVYKFTLEPIAGKNARDNLSNTPTFMKAPPVAPRTISNHTNLENQTRNAVSVQQRVKETVPSTHGYNHASDKVSEAKIPRKRPRDDNLDPAHVHTQDCDKRKHSHMAGNVRSETHNSASLQGSVVPSKPMQPSNQKKKENLQKKRPSITSYMPRV